MTKLTKAVPSKLQLDGWWLDHATRPFPKSVVAAKVGGPEAKP
jgi:hypothetical protein